MCSLLVSRNCPFSVEDLETASTDFLRRFGFIHMEARSEFEEFIWRLLIGSTARNIALSTIVLSGDRSDEVLSFTETTEVMLEGTKLRHKAWRALLGDAWARREEDLQDQYPTYAFSNSITDKIDQEIERRCWRIETAIHHWPDWKSDWEKTRRLLDGLYEVNLQAIQVGDEPKHAALSCGLETTIQFRIRNWGRLTWPAGCYIEPLSHCGCFSTGSDVTANTILCAIPPDQEAVVDTNITATRHCKNEKLYWRLRTPGGAEFGLVLVYKYFVLVD